MAAHDFSISFNYLWLQLNLFNPGLIFHNNFLINIVSINFPRPPRRAKSWDNLLSVRSASPQVSPKTKQKKKHIPTSHNRPITSPAQKASRSIQQPGPDMVRYARASHSQEARSLRLCVNYNLRWSSSFLFGTGVGQTKLERGLLSQFDHLSSFSPEVSGVSPRPAPEWPSKLESGGWRQ